MVVERAVFHQERSVIWDSPTLGCSSYANPYLYNSSHIGHPNRDSATCVLADARARLI
ncbi:hypothetical protein ACFLSF_01185 [Candidatus Bipolaricaulota bacterium]